MSTQKTNRSTEFNRILTDLSNFFEEPLRAVVKLAYKKGAKKGEIAKTLKVDPSLISNKYKSSFDEIDKEVNRG